MAPGEKGWRGETSQGRALTALIFRGWPADARTATLPRSAVRRARDPGETRRRALRPRRAGAAAATACVFIVRDVLAVWDGYTRVWRRGRGVRGGYQPLFFSKIEPLKNGTGDA